MLKQTLIRAATEAGKLIKEFSTREFSISNKEGINNLVTEVDHASETLIMGIIREEYPDHYILTEESGDLPKDSAYKWIIDPIDGTVNYANGIPLCCVSIGVEKDGEVILGAIYNPFIDEFFLTEKNNGVTLNNKPVKVSRKAVVLESCLVTGFPYTHVDAANGPLEVFSRFIKKGVPIRRLGSAAMDLAWVACGRFDGFFEHSLNAWDSAAGYLMVKEAGGEVTDFDGNPYSPYQPRIIATNGLIHDELLLWINDKI